MPMLSEPSCTFWTHVRILEIATAHRGVAIQRRCLLVLCIDFPVAFCSQYKLFYQPKKKSFTGFPTILFHQKYPYFKSIYGFSPKKIERFPALLPYQYILFSSMIFPGSLPILPAASSFYHHNFSGNLPTPSAVYPLSGTTFITNIPVCMVLIH